MHEQYEQSVSLLYEFNAGDHVNFYFLLPGTNHLKIFLEEYADLVLLVQRHHKGLSHLDFDNIAKFWRERIPSYIVVEDKSFSGVDLNHIEFQHIDLTPLLRAENESVLLRIVVANSSSYIFCSLFWIDDLTRLHYSGMHLENGAFFGSNIEFKIIEFSRSDLIIFDCFNFQNTYGVRVLEIKAQHVILMQRIYCWGFSNFLNVNDFLPESIII